MLNEEELVKTENEEVIEEPVEKVEAEVVDSGKDFDVLIEEKRDPLYKSFLKSKKVSNFLTFGVLGMVIAGMILVPNEAMWMKILGWSLLGAGMVAMLLFYFLSKRTFDGKTREYISFVNATINQKTFSNEKFENIDITDGKIEVDGVAGNGVYKNVVRVASRNVIKGSYEGINFQFAEAALFKRDEGKKQPTTAAFVGKFIDVTNELNFAGNIVINISREEPVDAPNALDDKKLLYNEDGVAVYGDENCKFRDIIGEHFFGNVKKIKAANHLLNLAFSFWAGHTFVFMSYDDDVIALPFDKPINKDAVNSFVDDLEKVFNVVKLLGK